MNRVGVLFSVCAGFLLLVLPPQTGTAQPQESDSASVSPSEDPRYSEWKRNVKAGGTTLQAPAPAPTTTYTATQRSGHPQILISGATREEVTNAIANRLSANGWTVTKTTDYGLELEQPARGAAGFFGSLLSVNKYVTDPVYRLTFGVSESGAAVRVTAAQALIQNPHTGTESPVRLDRKKHEAPLWDLLESLQRELGRASTPKPPVSAQESLADIPPNAAWPSPGSIGQAPRDAPFGLTSSFDRFEDVRYVSTGPSKVAVSVPSSACASYVAGQVMCHGDTIGSLFDGRLSLLCLGGSLKSAAEASNLILLADDTRLVFNQLEHRDVDGNSHSVSVRVPIDTLLLIAEATNVEGRLGTHEFAFDAQVREKFHGLAQLIRSIPTPRPEPRARSAKDPPAAGKQR